MEATIAYHGSQVVDSDAVAAMRSAVATDCFSYLCWCRSPC